MQYRTIVVHVDKSGLVKDRIASAAQPAPIEPAHLVGVAMAGMPVRLFQSVTLAAAYGLERCRENMERKPEDAAACFDDFIRGSGVDSFGCRKVLREVPRHPALAARISIPIG